MSIDSSDPSRDPSPASALLDDNVQPYSVSELAFALKRTVEDAYGYVRIRGEVSKVTRHASGHIYLSLKDERAALDAVVWKGSVRSLACQPQTGLEVIVTGRITTYPARSSYQMVVETMAPAGVGALLAQLERLKAKLQGEGLFQPERKRPLPPSPAVIGVITSPTGAVIRDILHRIKERWPCHVLVWPVVVQGGECADQVAEAIRGFNALPAGPGGPARPDLLIVARGGGSIEDLWPFNDEALAREVSRSAIPLISAVGHETDVTLIDYVADKRAPTPTAAAELATPVLAELTLQVLSYEQRMGRCAQRALEGARTRLASAQRGLPKLADLLGFASQRFDLAAGRLAAALQRNIGLHERAWLQISGRLSPHLLDRPRQAGAQRAAELGRRMAAACDRRLAELAERLSRIDQLRRSLDPDGPLARGFARVHDGDGALVRTAASLSGGEAVDLVFVDGRRRALVEPAHPGPDPVRKPFRARRPGGPPEGQGSLF